MEFRIRNATATDIGAIRALIGASVRALQPEYGERQREAALQTVFTVDTRLITDGTYFVAEADGVLAGCGGWSFRSKLFGGDHHHGSAVGSGAHPHSDVSEVVAQDGVAKIRAIFVHPDYARQGLGRLLLRTAEAAAVAAGFHRLEMGSTLAGLALYTQEGYRQLEREEVRVGREDSLETIEVVRMVKEVA